jgi:signal transduction histidine kinase
MRGLRRLHDTVRGHPRGADLAMAVVVYAATLVTTVGAVPRPGSGRLSADAALAAAAACGALGVRRRWPFAALLISAAGAEAYLAHYHGDNGVLILAAPLIALYTLADSGDRRRALTVGGLAVLALAGVHAVVKAAAWPGPENIALAALGGLALAAGDASRSRRAYLAGVEERARRAEREREQEARRQVTEERLRIARDLHDSVGHHLALINVQAGVAAHVWDDQPGQARTSLAHIRRASRTALDELRDTIGLLRTPDDPSAPTEPTVGLIGLDDLVASFRRSGLQLAWSVEGGVRPLPKAADLTAYRVIQESLTNVCKHAPAARVALRLDYRPSELHILVDNDDAGRRVAPRPSEPPAGNGTRHGLVGMRERLHAIGGSVAAGPRPGGFRVVATVPFDGAT